MKAEEEPGALRLSVLDQSPIPAGATGAQVLRNTLDLARHADALGYHRYWLAEHHGGVMLAGASPELLIGPVANVTARLRVGSGGVMLPHYSPLKVAENFSILSALHPGRIDLGVGRAAGTDPHTALALQRDRRRPSPDDFPQQMEELLGYLENRLPHGHRFARLAAALPGHPERPEPWLLGSSEQSGIWAAELGLPYAFADFINPTGADIAAHYRRRFQPSERLDRPRVIVAAWALCADTDAEARRLFTSSQMMMARLYGGQSIPVPPVTEAEAFLENQDSALLEALARRRRAIVGAPETVRAGLQALVRHYGAEEVMVVTITHSHTARRRSYQLLAEAFAEADDGI